MAVRTIVSAAVVVPVGAPPLAWGAVALDDAGIITAVGEREHILARVDDAPEIRVDGVLMPGLVNAHTHLQFTDFAHIGTQAHDGFEEWSRAFDAEYFETSSERDWASSALRGARTALATGTTAMADIVSDLPAIRALDEAGMRGVAYLETLGHSWAEWKNGRRDEYLATLDEALQSETSRVRIGMSPHAPYSLDTRVLTDMAALAIEKNCRIHTHLGESAFEDAYCRTGTGPLADFVRGFGRDFQIVMEGGVGTGTAHFADAVGLLGAESHVAHGIYLDAESRDLLRRRGTSVALCPRSNQVIGLSAPPVAAYLREEVPIAIGTDSLSSSPSLDLMEDVGLLFRTARQQGYEGGDLGRLLVEAATIGGARAMGLTDLGVGVLAPGSRGDMAVFGIEATVDNVFECLARDGAGACTTTFIDGFDVTPGDSERDRMGEDTTGPD